MSELEQRYASLLRLYPPAYRRARGAEMLAVLMDSAPPDRRRPEWREARGLILGALQAWAGAQGHRTTGQSWRVALRTAALILLTQAAGIALSHMMYDSTNLPTVKLATGLTIAAVCLSAIVAVFCGAYLVAAVVTAGAIVLQSVSPELYWYFSTGFVSYLSPSWQLPLALVLVIPLIGRGKVVAPRALNLLLVVPVVSVALDGYGTLARDPSFQTGGRAIWQAFAIVAILWSIVDERVAIAFGLAFFSVVVNRALGSMPPVLDDWSAMPATFTDWASWRWTLIDMGLLAILPILDITVGAAVAMRRARI